MATENEDKDSLPWPEPCSPEEAEYVVTVQKPYYPEINYYRTETDALRVYEDEVEIIGQRASRNENYDRIEAVTIAKIIRTKEFETDIRQERKT